VRILVLGGDGYLGWPTALYLSRRGHSVGIVDNFARRHYDFEMGVDSLVPIESLQVRVAVWREQTGKAIAYYVGNLCDADFTYDAKATEVSTPAAEAFAARRGVCQDFAHIMIAGLRGLGLPAAYVSGYLRTIPPQGQPRL